MAAADVEALEARFRQQWALTFGSGEDYPAADTTEVKYLAEVKHRGKGLTIQKKGRSPSRAPAEPPPLRRSRAAATAVSVERVQHSAS